MKCSACEELRKEVAALREEIRQLRLQPQRIDHYHHAVAPNYPVPVPLYPSTTPPWFVTCGVDGDVKFHGGNS